MEKDQHEALSEVGRLNLRKRELNNELRKKERDLGSVQNKIEFSQRELRQVGVELKKLRGEKADLKKQLDAIKKEIGQEREKIQSERNDLISLKEAVEKKLEEVEGERENLTNRSSVLKTKSQEVRKERDEIDKGNAQLEKKTKAMDEEKKSFEQVRIKSEADIRSRKLELAKELGAIHEEKDNILTHHRNLKAVKEDQAIRRSSLDGQEARQKKTIEAIAIREAECVKREAGIRLGQISNEKIKEALDSEGKVVELDRLRVEKLAREKDVDRDLAKIKSENEKK